MDSKILLTFGDVIRLLFSISMIALISFSCTKEEQIDFKDSERDTLEIKDYKRIDGTYEGTITNIRFINQNQYVQTGLPKPFTVVFSEINFDRLKADQVTNLATGEAEVELFRFNEDGGYFTMLAHTMPDDFSGDTLFQNPYTGRYQFNGIYYYGSGNLQYFIRRIVSGDTTQQVFEGVKK